MICVKVFNVFLTTRHLVISTLCLTSDGEVQNELQQFQAPWDSILHFSGALYIFGKKRENFYINDWSFMHSCYMLFLHLGGTRIKDAEPPPPHRELRRHRPFPTGSVHTFMFFSLSYCICLFCLHSQEKSIPQFCCKIMNVRFCVKFILCHFMEMFKSELAVAR